MFLLLKGQLSVNAINLVKLQTHLQMFLVERTDT